MDSGVKQRLRGINITQAYNYLPTQQHLFDLGTALLQLTVQNVCIKGFIQWLKPQFSQQFLRTGIIFTLYQQYCTKTAWIVQAQQAFCRMHLEMVMLTKCRQIRCKAQTARHAQMQQQQPLTQIHQ